jgi:hypothetical protein
MDENIENGRLHIAAKHNFGTSRVKVQKSGLVGLE